MRGSDSRAVRLAVLAENVWEKLVKKVRQTLAQGSCYRGYAMQAEFVLGFGAER